jgi:hypothetical protein
VGIPHRKFAFHPFELLNRPRWITNVQLPVVMADCIKTFYNPARRHSSLNCLTPNEFENLHLTQSQTAFSYAWFTKRGLGPLVGPMRTEPTT